MIASIDIRLTSMLSALTGAILPAVQDNPFANEQAQLLVGHLQVLQAQEAHAEEYERLEHLHTRRLATEIVDGDQGGPRASAAGDRVAAALAEPVASETSDLRRAQSALTAVVTEFLAAQAEDGTDEAIARSTRIVLSAERAQSLRDRSFFGPFGYESGDTEVLPLEDMMTSFRAEYADERATA